MLLKPSKSMILDNLKNTKEIKGITNKEKILRSFEMEESTEMIIE